MNLMKRDLSVNRLSFLMNCYRRCHITPKNSRALLTFGSDLSRNHCNFLTQNSISKNINETKLLDNYIGLCPLVTTVRCLAKGKDKPKDKKKGKPKVVLTDDEMSELIPINQLKIELDKVVEKFKTDLITNVSVRSNPNSIDSLIIDFDGQKIPLSSVANITRKSPQLVVVNLSSMPDAIKPVMTAIAQSGMNLSPQQEANVIYLPIPKVTREHRQGLATNAKTLFNRAKDEVKDIYSSFSSYVTKQKKSHVSEELIFNVNENLKFLIDHKIHELEVILEQKLKELLN